MSRYILKDATYNECFKSFATRFEPNVYRGEVRPSYSIVIMC